MRAVAMKPRIRRSELSSVSEIDVEQASRRDDAHVEHGAERLAARDERALCRHARQNGQRLLEGIGAAYSRRAPLSLRPRSIRSMANQPRTGAIRPTARRFAAKMRAQRDRKIGQQHPDHAVQHAMAERGDAAADVGAYS